MKLFCEGSSSEDQPRSFLYVAEFEDRDVEGELAPLLPCLATDIWAYCGEALRERKGTEAFVCRITLKLRNVPNVKADFKIGDAPIDYIESLPNSGVTR